MSTPHTTLALEKFTCTPFADQRMGTAGLRKKVRVFRQPHYLESFMQAVLDTLALPQGAAAIAGGASVPKGGTAVADGVAFGIPVVTDGGHIRKLEEVEADMIRLALARYQGQMSEVARKLGIGRSTLYRRMKDLGLDEAASG